MPMFKIFKNKFGKNRIKKEMYNMQAKETSMFGYMASSEIARMLSTSKDDKTHGGKR